MAAWESNSHYGTKDSYEDELPLKANILLAEDNIVNQEVATRMLMKLGCNVETAINGIEAVEMAEKGSYDLILMDCQMPEMDGYAATKEIRQRLQTEARIPIIAVSASAMQEDIECCLEAGMDDFISKPVKMKELKRIINKWYSNVRIRTGSAEEHIGKAGINTTEASGNSLLFSEDNPVSAEGMNILIDREGALDRLGGDEELFMELVQLFMENAPEQIAQLEEAIKAMDIDTARRASHSLKGSAANVGVVNVQQEAFQAESAAKNGDWEGLRFYHERIKTELEKVRSFLLLSEKTA